MRPALDRLMKTLQMPIEKPQQDLTNKATAGESQGSSPFSGNESSLLHSLSFYYPIKKKKWCRNLRFALKQNLDVQIIPAYRDGPGLKSYGVFLGDRGERPSLPSLSSPRGGAVSSLIAARVSDND
ncbi:hypothetical protein J6590_068069 [Homalodisca vitripennis]|nr:hypothetical protein J6590_068069 [Homalodisca vitripennis]